MDAVETTAPWASKARHSSTYRAARRNAAKRVRAWKGGTIRDLMTDAPFQRGNLAAMLLPVYKKYSKVSKKVYRGGNVPGSVRRLRAMFKPTNALKDAFLQHQKRVSSV